MKKRVLSMILVLVMLAGVSVPALADGSRDYANDPEWFGTDDGETVTLRFWCGIQPEYGYQQMIDNFNAEYADKGVQAEYNRYVNNSDGNLQLETYLMGNEGVDVFIGYGSVSRLLDRANGGMLYDYSDYLDSIGFDITTELGSKAAADCVFDGGAVYGLPTKFDNNGWMTINATAFEEAGIPIPYEGWTYDEFKQACEKLTHGEGQDKVYGMCWGMNFESSATINYLNRVLDHNAWFKDDSMKETNLDSPVLAEGLNLIKDTIDQGWAMSLEDELADDATIQTVFLTGKCAMFGTFSQLRVCMDTAEYPHDFTTAMVPFPVPSEEYADFKTQSQSAYSGDYISIASGCENKKAACEFLRWYIQGGMNPIILAARYPLWSGNDIQEILDIVKEQAGDTVDVESLEHLLSIDMYSETEPSLINEHESEIKDITWEEIQNFLLGRTDTAEEALAAAKERADALLQ